MPLNVVMYWGLAVHSLLDSSVLQLSKEEKDQTAEFLLTHPVSRRRIITEKLTAVLVQIVVMNVIILSLSLLWHFRFLALRQHWYPPGVCCNYVFSEPYCQYD